MAFPSAYAKIFFAAMILLSLYFSQVVIKPYLIQIFLAVVLFFTGKPLYRSLAWLFRDQRALAPSAPAFCWLCS